ncbi:secretin N-terminal domain-containing protein [Rheinheimera sp.]|uniref:secretin N-terminal domain-containing protein n=1 Tax=Rheinheimera sp. TaxID=1869214 RepID=UPI00307F87FD
MIMKLKMKPVLHLVLSATLAISGCAAPVSPYQVKPSVLNGLPETTTEPADQTNAASDVRNQTQISALTGVKVRSGVLSQDKTDEQYFSASEMVTLAAENMRLEEFIHHVFGGVLGANYVISQALSQAPQQVTLNISEPMSKKALYRQVKELLLSNAAYISYKDKVFYFHPLTQDLGANLQIGIGQAVRDVPATAGQILQIIPLQYGITISIERTLRELTKAKLTVDFDQSALFVEGTREQILQVLDLVSLLDQPSHRAKHISFISLVYVNPDDFVKQIATLLDNEGIPVAIGSPQQKNLVLVPMAQNGGIAVFASNSQFLQRVAFWASKIDQPPQGAQKQYFIYHPKYARARDLGDSLLPLFGGGGTTTKAAAGNDSRDTQSSVNNKVAPTAQVNSVTSEQITIVVDERANMVIFETTGTRYQALLPLIRRLDIMPRQVVLEATIAEVTLTDEFRFGVEAFLKDGKFSLNTQGNFAVTDIAGGTLSFASSVNKFNLAALQSNTLVNVLSNPTLLVRDGTTATISVGEEIPIITSTESNFDQTPITRTNIDRRQTGLELSVTPTINTEGVVIMEIEQKISNQVNADADASSQIVLNRNIKTEVVANSGQTIILGGLISENNSNSDNQVPLLGKIPLLGNLFKSKADTRTKTELVILVTPKIIFDEKQWDEIRKNFSSGLENVKF